MNSFGWTRPIVKGSKGEKYYSQVNIIGPLALQAQMVMDQESARRKEI